MALLREWLGGKTLLRCEVRIGLVAASLRVRVAELSDEGFRAFTDDMTGEVAYSDEGGR